VPADRKAFAERAGARLAMMRVMSLRVRLLVVASLAVVALAIATVTVLRLIADSESLGLHEADRSNQVALAALAAAATGSVDHANLDAKARHALEPMIDTRGGYCWGDGDYIWEQSADLRGKGPPPGPPRPHARSGEGVPGPPEHVRAAVLDACRQSLPGKVQQIELEDRIATTAISVHGIAPGLSAFAMRIVWGRESRGTVSPALLALAVTTLLGIALTLHSLWTLRRGARQLATGLGQLEVDPHAAIERPQTRELARIADGVRALARRLADAQLRQLELERSTAHQRKMSSLGRLVAGIAHEVRNPLTGIKLLLDGIRRRAPETRDDVDTALREIARLDQLVGTSLGVARHGPSEPVEVELAELVAERIAVLAGHAGSKAVSIEARGRSRRSVERDAVVRILDNLLRNAVDASPVSGTIDVVIGDSTIDVIDRGPGVPPEQQATLFEPFVTSKPNGTGLGLWMSLTLAESRGGTLRYRRAEAMTHFTLELGSG
jgi:signal transduction histidine kinase